MPIRKTTRQSLLTCLFFALALAETLALTDVLLVLSYPIAQDGYKLITAAAVLTGAFFVPAFIISGAIALLSARFPRLRMGPALAFFAGLSLGIFLALQFIFRQKGVNVLLWWGWPATIFSGLFAGGLFALVYLLLSRTRRGLFILLSVGCGIPLIFALAALTIWRGQWGADIYGATTVTTYQVSLAVRISGALLIALLLPKALKPLPVAGVAVVMLFVALNPDFASASVDSAANAARVSPRQQPPVILITVDTLRADAVSAYNPDAPPTPHIDSLAANSLLFTRAYSPAPWTLPALVSMMTGLSPRTHGVVSSSLTPDPAIPLLADYLRSADYTAAGIVSSPFLRPRFGLTRGFLRFDFYPDNVPGGSFALRLLHALFPRYFPLTEASTRNLVDSTLRWFDKRPDEPFFFWLHIYDPHHPYSPPERHLPEGLAEDSDARSRHSHLQDIYDKGFLLYDFSDQPTPEARRYLHAMYLAEVAYVDEQLGRLFDYLRTEGLYDRSLIIFTSDHGEEFWDHGKWGHGHVFYDEVIRVPFMIKLPGGGSVRRVEIPVSTAALTPTLVDYLSIPHRPEAFEERSIAEMLRQSQSPRMLKESEAAFEIPPDPYPANAVTPPVFSAGNMFGPPAEAAVFDHWKWIQPIPDAEVDTPSESDSALGDSSSSSRGLLFNLRSDSLETSSLTRSRPAKAAEGERHLRSWQQRSMLLREQLDIEAKQGEIDEDTLEQLRAFGYLD